MKRFVLVASALLMVFSIIFAGACSATAVTDISAQKASSLMQENQNNADFVILDVRTAQEYADGHLNRAVNLDFNAPAFRAGLETLDKSKTYLVYCRSGNRSRQAVNLMNELGFKKIYHINGGIIEWNANGLPTVKESPTSFKYRPLGPVLLTGYAAALL